MSRTISGSRASLKINGKKIAFIGGVTVTEENTLTDIEVMDQLEVAELAETAHKVSFTCNFFKVNGNSAIDLGLSPKNINDILSQPEMTMELYDRIDDKVIYTISGVKFEGGSFSIDARGVASGSFNFKGRIGRGL
jgi:hypothetical protein